MSVPASYDEQTLSQFMLACLGPSIVSILGLTPADLQEAIADTVLACGVTTPASAPSILQLRAFARRAAWRLACDRLVSTVNLSIGDKRVNRGDIYTHAKERLAEAEYRCRTISTTGSYMHGVLTTIKPDNDFTKEVS